MTPFDPYSVLGVGPSAGEHELKTAYRARSRLLHPDFHRDAAGSAPQAAHEAFTQLCAAYRLALTNLDSAPVRGALARTLTEVLGSEVAPAVPSAPVASAAGPARSAPTGPTRCCWRASPCSAGWLVTDWLPAFLAYSAQ